MAQNTTHRYTKAVRIKPEKISEYKRLHTDVWPEVTNALLQVGISNYSLFVIGDLAVEYLEYSGEDFEENLETDFSFEIPKLARFRVNAFNQMRGAGAVFRTIPADILTLEDLGAPAPNPHRCQPISLGLKNS